MSTRGRWRPTVHRRQTCPWHRSSRTRTLSSSFRNRRQPLVCCQNTKLTDAMPKDATPTPEEQDECSVRVTINTQTIPKTHNTQRKDMTPNRGSRSDSVQRGARRELPSHLQNQGASWRALSVHCHAGQKFREAHGLGWWKPRSCCRSCPRKGCSSAVTDWNNEHPDKAEQGDDVETKQIQMETPSMGEAHTVQKVPSCTKTRDVELKRVTLQRKQSDHPGKVNWWPIRPRTQWQEQSRQRDRSREPRCRKALPTNRHIAWRSGNSCREENPGRQDHGKTQWVQLRERVLITLESWDDSHMVRARRLWSIRNIQQKSVYRIQQKTAPQGGFHGRPQRSRDRIQRRGDARVHETNREIALRGWPPRSSSSREEKGDGTQEVLPRTTTTLVVLKTSGTTLWQSPKDQKERVLSQ